jgi:hypothetical protein
VQDYDPNSVIDRHCHLYLATNGDSNEDHYDGLHDTSQIWRVPTVKGYKRLYTQLDGAS